MRRLLFVDTEGSSNLVHHPLTEDHCQLSFCSDDLAFVQDNVLSVQLSTSAARSLLRIPTEGSVSQGGLGTPSVFVGQRPP